MSVKIAPCNNLVIGVNVKIILVGVTPLKNLHCSQLFFDTNKFTERKGDFLITASTKIYRPSVSSNTFLISIWSSSIRMRTPLLYLATETSIRFQYRKCYRFLVRKQCRLFCLLIHVNIGINSFEKVANPSSIQR